MGKYVEEANSFFKKVAVELNDPEDIDRASRVTTAVLHTFRDRILPEESMHLISQLPMILKGIYVDGWNISLKPKHSKTIDEFLNEVRTHTRTAGRDFGSNQQTRDTVMAVLRVLQDQYVSVGETEDIKANLPGSLADLFE